ncbi:MAG: carbohydrate porin, partial [Candidatus Saccharimonadales bacterium]
MVAGLAMFVIAGIWVRPGRSIVKIQHTYIVHHRLMVSKHVIVFLILSCLNVLFFFSAGAQSLMLVNQQTCGQNEWGRARSSPFTNFKKDSAIYNKGLLNKLKGRGITFGVSETLEGYYNFTGGLRAGSAMASTFDANISADLKKLLDIKGGMFYADLEDHAGDNPTDILTGDFQVFDKHNSAPFLQLLELWYQQRLFDDKLRVKIGKIDANSEFSVIDNGLNFINSSTQVTPTFFVFPTFPDPVPAINVFFTPGRFFYTSFAVNDANRSDHFLDFYGEPTAVQPTLHGELLISESGINWDLLPLLKGGGNLKIGFWEHTGTFTKFDGDTQQGAKGYYMIFDQTLWQPVSKPDDERGLRMFLEYARTEKSLTPIYQHFGGGLVWTGLTAGHPENATGISAHYTNLSPYLN